MSLMTVRDALDWLNAAAPFDTAEDFDNVGLLIGDERLPVQNVVFGPVSYTHLTLPTIA